MNYKRVNKAIARKLYNYGCDVLLLPCKVNDTLVYDHFHQWIRPVTININTCDCGENKFDRSVNEYEYYNCNAELGYYSHYFVSEQDLETYNQMKEK